MFSKLLKAFGILALIALFMFGAVEIWLDRNKENIFRKVQTVLNDNLNGNLEIEDIRFRPFRDGLGLNFTLVNVKLTDSLFKSHKVPFLQAELIHVTLDLNGFYKGDIRIKNLVFQNGNASMFKRRDGYSNLTIFKSEGGKEKKSGSQDGLINKFGRLRFINFAVSFADSVTGKSYAALFQDVTNEITRTDSTSNTHFTGAVRFKGLVFKPEKGGFLINQETNLDLSAGYDTDSKVLNIYPSILKSATNDEISIGGNINFADSAGLFELSFKATKIAVKNALPLLNTKVRKQIDSIGINTNVDTQVKILGKVSGGNELPRVDVHFKTDTFNYSLPIGNLRKMLAEGDYTNQGDTSKLPSIANARLSAPDVHGFFETIPVKFKLVLSDFTNPRATFDGVVRADSSNLDQILDPSRYRFKHGKANIDFHFNGNLKKFYNPETDKFDGNLYGKVSIQNIAMDYLPRQVHLKNINAEFVFNESALVFPNLNFSDGQNMLFMQGKVMDFIPYLFGSPKPLRALVNVNIPVWKLNWLETLLAPRQLTTVKRKKKLKLVDLLDNVMDNIEILAKLQSKELRYKNFVGNNVLGRFTVKNNSVKIENFSLRAFGSATVQVSGEMNNSGSGQLPSLMIKGKVANADVHKLFYAFNNFGQKAITSENIKGKISTEFNFETKLNNSVKIVPSTMKGSLRFNLSQGYLINFEPLMKIKKLVFKKRNFEKVEFAPIRSHFSLSGQEINISPMEIESNVITLFIDGIYSFANKTDINIQIPLSNFKKRDSTYVLNPNDPQRKEGSKIYLRAIDEEGEVNIKLAFRKKKGKDKDLEKGLAD